MVREREVPRRPMNAKKESDSAPGDPPLTPISKLEDEEDGSDT